MRLLRSGSSYRVNGPPHNRPLREELASELERVLEQFAASRGFGPTAPLAIKLGAGVVGHHRSGRAVDIYEVGGVGLDAWHAEWSRCIKEAVCAGSSKNTIRLRCRHNLGVGLYRALVRGGRWAKPAGYPVQLFGPWTNCFGPHRSISPRLLRAHFDHIHVAK